MHIKEELLITNEGKLNRCTECGIFQHSVGATHQSSQICKKRAQIRKDRIADKMNKESATTTSFKVGSTTIKNVEEFKYLGRIIDKDDDDWPAVKRNITRARAVWGRLARILSSENATATIMGTIYKAVVQSILLYGAETWVLNKMMIRKLNSFHRRWLGEVIQEST